MAARTILIMGLPGAGKTVLAKALAPCIGAVHFNADAVRANVNKDLGFTLEDRLEQARRMGWLCGEVIKAGVPAIADFICPTAATRLAFGPAFTIFVDRITECRFADTNRLFEPPAACDVRVGPVGSVDYWVEIILPRLSEPRAGFPPRLTHDSAVSAGQDLLPRSLAGV